MKPRVVNFGQFLSFNLSTLRNRYTPARRKSVFPSVDYSDIAFQIATTERLSELLPNLLAQSALQASCHSQLENYDSLYVLTPAPGMKYHVHTAANNQTDPQLLNYFEALTVQSRGISNSQSTKNLGPFHFIFFPLQNRESDWMAYLVVAFKGKTPQDNQTANLLRPLRDAVQRGLLAHQNKVESVARAISQERQSQAADLHDSVAQILGYLKLRSSSLSALCLEQSNPTMLKIACDIEEQIGFAHRLTRELISSSRLNGIESNLSFSIQNALEELEQHSGIVFELDNRAKEDIEQLPYPNETLFIVREALCNLVRHSHASHARIIIKTESKALTILIEDNGIGIQTRSKRRDSFGLRIMEERARRMRAQLTVEDRQQGGTRVRLDIPRDHLTI
ncbi:MULTISPECIES: sensor histidine kinase [Thiomicrorhabdus]|uniref:histidine kinase n=1 Tax=Thiomicrorhabdus heinhorstiae TaxID=2748010 RepID=A0ABS0BX34_9GAMM|nr:MULTISPECIES: ATP-binding protein [Thiomicrorhabdus]MBF6057396.1 hypothetical protein [Thiomicrorhabdus heinhorstiae]